MSKLVYFDAIEPVVGSIPTCHRNFYRSNHESDQVLNQFFRRLRQSGTVARIIVLHVGFQILPI